MSVLAEPPKPYTYGGAGEISGSQYLTFLLGDEEYGVDILRVQEIRGWDKPTPIPNAAEYVAGVINLRGSIVPVINLRLRFSKPAIPCTGTTVVVVVRVTGEKGERVIGLMVDAVCDVRSVSSQQITPTPELGSAQVGFVTALATLENGMLILLDIDRLGNPAVSASSIPNRENA